ncbi:MAG: sigma-70 family RNA polymerase sigma factor [Saprospiraceae bacterium]|nr:sigma-70 family RNA polymerase sigma factor [Saprospiraceae bacterium]
MKSLKPADSITGLLNRMDGPDDQEHLMRTIYDHLHQTAERLLRNERPNHTLCPTDLIGESYAKLFLNQKLNVIDRNHFFSIAANAMRQILIDYARSKKRLKRNGIQITLSWVDKGKQDHQINTDLFEIENALVHLEDLDPRQAKIVELKFYAGLTVEEIASILEISESTVKREWATAKLFLKSQISI